LTSISDIVFDPNMGVELNLSGVRTGW